MVGPTICVGPERECRVCLWEEAFWFEGPGRRGTQRSPVGVPPVQTGEAPMPCKRTLCGFFGWSSRLPCLPR